MAQLAAAYFARGEDENSMHTANDALNMSFSVQDKPAEAAAKNEIGKVFLKRGSNEEALEAFTGAKDLYKSYRDPSVESSLDGSIQYVTASLRKENVKWSGLAYTTANLKERPRIGRATYVQFIGMQGRQSRSGMTGPQRSMPAETASDDEEEDEDPTWDEDDPTYDLSWRPRY